MTEIKSVPSIATQPDLALIELLERQLEKARKGEILGAAIAFTYGDNSTGSAFIANWPAALLGELRILEREIVDAEIDLRLHESGTGY